MAPPPSVKDDELLKMLSSMTTLELNEATHPPKLKDLEPVNSILSKSTSQYSQNMEPP